MRKIYKVAIQYQVKIIKSSSSDDDYDDYETQEMSRNKYKNNDYDDYDTPEMAWDRYKNIEKYQPEELAKIRQGIRDHKSPDEIKEELNEKRHKERLDKIEKMMKAIEYENSLEGRKKEKEKQEKFFNLIREINPNSPSLPENKKTQKNIESLIQLIDESPIKNSTSLVKNKKIIKSSGYEEDDNYKSDYEYEDDDEEERVKLVRQYSPKEIHDWKKQLYDYKSPTDLRKELKEKQIKDESEQIKKLYEWLERRQSPEGIAAHNKEIKELIDRVRALNPKSTLLPENYKPSNNDDDWDV